MCFAWRTVRVLALVAAACAAGCRNSSVSPGVGAPPDPAPTEYVSTIDNPYFPQTPGTMFIHEGITDLGFLQTYTHVTFEIETVMAVSCTVVHTTEYLDGELVEESDDWYAQDVEGNVWYFGGIAQEYDDLGLPVPVTGSWRAGEDGAEPGIAMPADPRVGDPAYYQEYVPGVAEDMAIVEDLDATATVPFGSFEDCLQIQEFTPLDPTEKVLKYYAPGVGNVLETDLDGGNRLELVSVILPF